MNAYRIKKYIGAYATILNGLDAIVFTAGIGENSSVIRALVCVITSYSIHYTKLYDFVIMDTFRKCR